MGNIFGVGFLGGRFRIKYIWEIWGRKRSIMVDWYIDPILIINFTILNYPMQKSNAYLLSPIAPSLSPVKSETDINKTTLC